MLFRFLIYFIYLFFIYLFYFILFILFYFLFYFFFFWAARCFVVRNKLEEISYWEEWIPKYFCVLSTFFKSKTYYIYIYITRQHSENAPEIPRWKYENTIFAHVCSYMPGKQQIKFLTIFSKFMDVLVTWPRLSKSYQTLRLISGSDSVTHTQLTQCLWVQFRIHFFKFYSTFQIIDTVTLLFNDITRTVWEAVEICQSIHL